MNPQIQIRQDNEKGVEILNAVIRNIEKKKEFELREEEGEFCYPEDNHKDSDIHPGHPDE